jgi:hypothetical protein
MGNRTPASWHRYGLRIARAVEDHRPDEAAEMKRRHNLVSGYLDRSPEVAQTWHVREITYSRVLELAESEAMQGEQRREKRQRENELAVEDQRRKRLAARPGGSGRDGDEGSTASGRRRRRQPTQFEASGRLTAGAGRPWERLEGDGGDDGGEAGD